MFRYQLFAELDRKKTVRFRTKIPVLEKGGGGMVININLPALRIRNEGDLEND